MGQSGLYLDCNWRRYNYGGGLNQNYVDVTWNTIGAGLVRVYIDVSEALAICDAIENNHVTVNPTPSPEFNSWSGTVCPKQSVTYSITQTYSSHIWSISGGTVLAGGGSLDPSVTVRWGTVKPEPFQSQLKIQIIAARLQDPSLST